MFHLSIFVPLVMLLSWSLSNGSYKFAHVTQLGLNQSSKLLPNFSACSESQGNLALTFCLHQKSMFVLRSSNFDAVTWIIWLLWRSLKPRGVLLGSRSGFGGYP